MVAEPDGRRTAAVVAAEPAAQQAAAVEPVGQQQAAVD